MPFEAAVFPKPGADLAIIELPDLVPGDNEILIKVHACGCCHTDIFAKNGLISSASAYPLAPGHEVAGEIAAVGPGILNQRWKVGDRVAVGGFNGGCHNCSNCREGKFLGCKASKPFIGTQVNGGYAKYIVANGDAIAPIPDNLDYVQAGVLSCAGLTVFNSIRENLANCPPGSVVAVLGIGGLGGLAIQFASKMGFYTIAVSRGDKKKSLALESGAHVFIDSSSQNAVEELKKLGGARIILATTTGSHDTLGTYVDALDAYGVLVVAGIDDEGKPISAAAMNLVIGSKAIRGGCVGNAQVLEETLKFAARFNVRAKVEVFPFSKSKEAYDRMVSGQANLRVAIDHDL